MDIKQLKSSMKLAELRMKSNPSEDNLAILKAATEAFEFALDPEKKTAGPSHEDAAEPVVPKPSAAPKPAAPKQSAVKPAAEKPATPKVETSSAATQPTQSEPSTPQSQEQQSAQETASPA